MSGQALYRRWRSQSFEQVIAQDHVTRTLQNALRSGRIAHAYLFTGPRGTGKTSTARILAKAANCLAEPEQRPCNQCALCQAINEGRALDLIEIDAASNRGIDEIRELRDKVAFAPNEGRYKVYVIDEVHMLTTEAFNALLKTLEEPPAHVIFVLATTEPQKIPATILSRCQRFDFRRIPLADLEHQLNHICEVEGFRIQPAAIEAIARRAAGSFRDAESLLDQLAATGDAEITLERVQELLGAVPAQAVAELVDAWIDGDLATGLRLINRLVDEGADARQLHLEIIDHLRSLMLLMAGGDEKLAGASPDMAARLRAQSSRLSLGRLVDGLHLFSQSETVARGEVRPQMPLEMAFVQAVLLGRSMAEPAPAEERRSAPAAEPPAPASRPAAERPASIEEPRAVRRAERPAATSAQAPAPVERPAVASMPAQAPQPAEKNAAPVAQADMGALKQRWQQILDSVGKRNRLFAALVRPARLVGVQGNRLILEISTSSHRDRIMKDENRRTLEDALQEVLGIPLQVECRLPGEAPPAAREAPKPNTGVAPVREAPAQPASAGRAAPAQAAKPVQKAPAVQEDPLVNYLVRNLGAQVSAIHPDKGAETENTIQDDDASAASDD